MLKKFTGLSLVVAGILISLFSGYGCKQGEQAKPSAGIVAQEYTFETDAGKWWPTSDIKYTMTSDTKHGGASSLSITGTSPVGMWNFIESPEFNLEPGKKYNASGWMLVKSISDTKNAPFFKCGIKTGAKWLVNFNTNKYDLNRKGEWQELSVEFTAPQESNLKGSFSVEKGTKDEAIKVEMFIDDLRLEVRQ
jgi:hypothetical protein